MCENKCRKYVTSLLELQKYYNYFDFVLAKFHCFGLPSYVPKKTFCLIPVRDRLFLPQVLFFVVQEKGGGS